MKLDFYIIEDDSSVIRILENIISEYDMGTVLGNSCQSDEILNDIYDMKPDIVLVDFLLPAEDGLEIMGKIKKTDFSGKYIMISEVTAKRVIGEAYKLGVEYFINKPINVIEVIKVIEKVMNTIKAERMIELLGLDYKSAQLIGDKKDSQALNQVFMDLGIVGQSGIEDLMEIIKNIADKKKDCNVFTYRMNDLYKYIVEVNSSKGIRSNHKAVEQRIRRIAISAMENIASMGIEDFGNYKFEKYSTSLFNYKDIRTEMDYLRGKSNYRGKINVKKFIEGIISITCK